MSYSYSPIQFKTLHTRYSELVGCSTDNGARAVARRRLKLEPELFKAEITFGRIRHKMFYKETKETGKIPQIIADNMIWIYSQFAPHHADDCQPELYLKTKITSRLWLHSSIDNVSAKCQLVTDYKTTGGGADDFDPIQLYIYALACESNGIPIKYGLIIAEIWDKERTEILRYEPKIYTITPEHLDIARGYIKKRAKKLRESISILAPLA